MDKKVFEYMNLNIFYIWLSYVKYLFKYKDNEYSRWYFCIYKGLWVLKLKVRTHSQTLCFIVIALSLFIMFIYNLIAEFITKTKDWFLPTWTAAYADLVLTLWFAHQNRAVYNRVCSDSIYLNSNWSDKQVVLIHLDTL